MNFYCETINCEDFDKENGICKKVCKHRPCALAKVSPELPCWEQHLRSIPEEELKEGNVDIPYMIVSEDRRMGLTCSTFLDKQIVVGPRNVMENILASFIAKGRTSASIMDVVPFEEDIKLPQRYVKSVEEYNQI